MSIDKNVNDTPISVVICSATESVKASWLVKKGFTALRYLKDGKEINPLEKIPIPEIMIDIKRKKQFLNFLDSLLNFLIISERMTKSVGSKMIIPAYPIMKVVLFSNINENMIKLAENAGAAQIMKFFSFFTKGKMKKNAAVIIMKDRFPPHAETPNAKKNPAVINLIREIFSWLNLIPEIRRYIAMNAKKSPKGSDLNQPIKPLEKIGTDTANINAANNPAVVPDITRTKANTTIPVNDPITNGNKIVKVYNDEPKLKIG